MIKITTNKTFTLLFVVIFLFSGFHILASSETEAIGNEAAEEESLLPFDREEYYPYDYAESKEVDI